MNRTFNKSSINLIRCLYYTSSAEYVNAAILSNISQSDVLIEKSYTPTDNPAPAVISVVRLLLLYKKIMYVSVVKNHPNYISYIILAIENDRNVDHI